MDTSVNWVYTIALNTLVGLYSCPVDSVLDSDVANCNVVKLK